MRIYLLTFPASTQYYTTTLGLVQLPQVITKYNALYFSPYKNNALAASVYPSGTLRNILFMELLKNHLLILSLYEEKQVVIPGP